MMLKERKKWKPPQILALGALPEGLGRCQTGNTPTQGVDQCTTGTDATQTCTTGNGVKK